MHPTDPDPVGRDSATDLPGEDPRSAAPETSTLFAALLESINLGVAALDCARNVIAANARFLEILGRERAQTLGRPWDRVVGPELAAPVGRLLDRLFEEDDESSLDISWQRAPDEIIPLEIGASLLRAPSGAIIGAAVTFRDMSRSREIDKVRRLEKIKTDFISTVSHELRTPLASMIASVSLLRAGLAGELSPKQQELLGILHRNSYRLKELIEDILELSRLESGKPVLDLEETPVRRLVEQTLAAMKDSAREKGVSLSTAESIDFPARLDRRRVQRILDHLVGNAIRFTPPGGRITVSARREGNAAVFSVEDTGIGIPEEEQPRVFDKFYQVQDALIRTAQGSGLGLSICKRIVCMHGGDIWVDSAPGKGSCFSFRIPDPGHGRGGLPCPEDEHFPSAGTAG